jgi:hypothetical protein
MKNYNLSKMSLEEAKEKGKVWKLQMKKEIDDDLNIGDNDNNKIHDFDFELDPYSGLSFLMIGSVRSGKTTCLNWMMNNYFYPKKEKFVNLFFSNSYQSTIYDDVRKEKSVCGSHYYHPEIIKEAYQINRDTKNKYRFNIILDDIVDEKDDTELFKLLTIYRNSRLSCIILSQDLCINNSTARGNITHVLLFKLNNDTAIEKVVKSFLRSYYPTKMNLIDKIKQYRKDTEDHCFYHIDNLKNTITRCKIKLNNN